MRVSAHSRHEGETAMIAITFTAGPRLATIAPKVRQLATRLANALDAFAEARMRAAVPVRHLRRTQRDMDRCQALMHPPAHRKGRVRRPSSLVSPVG
jgi:hypothetical protein